MSQTIRRKGSNVRKVAAQQSKARSMRNAKAKTGSALDSFMNWLPVSEEVLQRLFLLFILAVAAIAVVVIARLAGVPELIGRQFAMAAGDVGFSVNKVEVRGVKHLNELKIYERVDTAMGRPMPEVDVDQIRSELVQLNWIEDARVSRQLPDRLVIDVVERKPHAVLRKPDKLVLIDATGHELEPVSPERAKGKLIVFGPGASKQVEALTKLLGAAPALKPQVTEAEWVGNRRWNVAFKTGQILALPEGEKDAANSLMTFARLDGVNRLLGGRVAVFDMRTAGRIYFRVPERAADAATATAKATAAKAAEKSASAETKDAKDTKDTKVASAKTDKAKPGEKKKEQQ
ncbi:cell division protein FtsQ/DivIB [Novosphingobium aquae]|jgi:cell division protein FtsQ|uniref:Cell division protein FtsQ n=1 Tax=Novosphingobium aquae TaxID=3133435 RepID=A0ABU8S6Q8_9SPHN